MPHLSLINHGFPTILKGPSKEFLAILFEKFELTITLLNNKFEKISIRRKQFFYLSNSAGYMRN
jgi:hypothetical protein